MREALNENVIRFSQIRRLPIDLIRYKFGRPDMDFIENTVKHLTGISRNDLEKCAAICFERRIKPNIYTEALKLIREELRGEKVFFATSSLGVIIRPLEQFFGIEGSLATELEFRDDITTGRLTGHSLFGTGKKDAIETWLAHNNLSSKDVCFYSDSYTDLPSLEFSGKATAVNPDRRLARVARKRGWEILRFSKTLGN